MSDDGCGLTEADTSNWKAELYSYKPEKSTQASLINPTHFSQSEAHTTVNHSKEISLVYRGARGL